MTSGQALIQSSVHSFLSGSKKMLIGGEWVDAASGKTFPTLNPATGEVLTHVPHGESEDIDRAVRAARQALEEGPWSRMTPSARGWLLYKLADLIEANAEHLAQLETLDNGKPIRESLNIDIPAVVEQFRYYAGWATKITGETIPVSFPGDHFHFTRREPVGVVGAIIPWNFPLLMASWKLAPALACGNTVVLKPAEQTPLTALRLGELIQEAGFPDGVVNIVTGFGEAGAALSAHMDVDKVAFTGSTEVGRKIMQASSGNLKRVSLELGGKSPNIIFEDADLSKAIPGAIMGIYFNQGQVCAAGSRVYVQKSVYDKVVEEMVNYSKKVRQGAGIELDTEMGPLVSQEQYDRVMNYISLGRSEGAELLCGGGRPADKDKGYFVQPTVFTSTNDNITIMKEEIFGPVVVVSPFNDVDEIVKRANSTIYGLAAGVWTRDISRAHKVANALKAGRVWVNCYNVMDPAAPWGGYKQSGFGREMGSYALELYTQVKSVWVSLD